MSHSACKETPEEAQGVYRLTDLNVSFVSSCPQGANPGALVMLKKERTNMTYDKEINVNVDLNGLSEQITKSLKEVMEPLVKKEKLDPNVIIDSVQAVISSSIEKSCEEINNSLKEKIEAFQKEFADTQTPVEKENPDEIIELNGKTFKKSVMGDEAFAAIAEIHKANVAMQKEMEHRDLIAQVEKEYPNVTGTPDQKAALLNVINHAEKEAREMGLIILKSANDLAGMYAEEVGENGIQKTTENFIKSVTDTDASLKLDKMAKELAAKEGITKAQAYLRVCATPEGEALYNQHVSNK